MEKRGQDADEDELSQLRMEVVQLRTMNLALEDRILQQQSSEHSVVSQAGRMFEKFSKNLSTRLSNEPDIPSRHTSTDGEGRPSDTEQLRNENHQLAKKLADSKMRHKETLRKKELSIAHLTQTVNRLQSLGKSSPVKCQSKRKSSEIVPEEVRRLKSNISKEFLGRKFLSEPNILVKWIHESRKIEEKTRHRSCSRSRKIIEIVKSSRRCRSRDPSLQEEVLLNILKGLGSSINKSSEESKIKAKEKIKADEAALKSFKETIDRQAQQIHGLGKELVASRSLLEEKNRSSEINRQLQDKLEASEALCCKLQNDLDNQSKAASEKFELLCTVQVLHRKLKEAEHAHQAEDNLEDKLSIERTCMKLEDLGSHMIQKMHLEDEEFLERKTHLGTFVHVSSVVVQPMNCDGTLSEASDVSADFRRFDFPSEPGMVSFQIRKLEKLNLALQMHLSAEKKLRTELENRLQGFVFEGLEKETNNILINAPQSSQSTFAGISLEKEIEEMEFKISELETLKRNLFSLLGISASDPLPQVDGVHGKTAKDVIEFYTQENSRLRRDLKTLASTLNKK